MSNPKQPPASVEQPLPPIDPRLMAAMYGMPEEDEIDLLEYWRVIWRKKWFIILMAMLAAVISAAVALQMPNIYKAEVLLAPAGSEKSGGGMSALGGLGGLASLAGISVGGGGNIDKNLAVLKSREFLWQFIKDEKLMPILFEDDWDADGKRWLESDPELQPNMWDAYRAMSDLLSAAQDKKSGLVTLSVEWNDPEVAAQWANTLVLRLNGFLRQQAIASSKDHLQYLHRELLHTEVADNRQALYTLISQEQKKAKPKRSLIVILSVFVVGFLSVIVVFIREGMARRKEEEQQQCDA